MSGYSETVELESGHRIQVYSSPSTSKLPFDIELLASYKRPLFIQNTATEKIIQYESGNENVDIMYVSNNQALQGGIGLYIEELDLFVSTSMFTKLYYQIKTIASLQDTQEFNLDDEIDENKGFQVVVSKTW